MSDSIIDNDIELLRRDRDSWKYLADSANKRADELAARFNTSAQSAAKDHVLKMIASFDGDPPDNAFQRGYLAALEVVRDEAFTSSEVTEGDRRPITLGDTVYMNEQSPFFHDWRGCEMKVVSLAIDPDGKVWASVIEGNPKHRGDGAYDSETTGINVDHLSTVASTDRATQTPGN